MTQLAHDVVTTLGFSCILVATSDIITTLCFQHVATTKNWRCHNVVFSTPAFRPGINVAATSWFWSRLPDGNLKVFQYHYSFVFPKTCNIAFQFHFLIKKCIRYVSMESVCSNGGYLKICSSVPEQRKEIFDLVQFTDQKQLPVFWR